MGLTYEIVKEVFELWLHQLGILGKNSVLSGSSRCSREVKAKTQHSKWLVMQDSVADN